MVHTKDGRSIRGVLTAVYRDELVLSQAEYLAVESTSPLTGDVVVPRENVAFIQTVPPAEPKPIPNPSAVE